MRKLTKLLVLVLSLALLAGSIFAVASFAADTGLTIEGATRTEIDFKDYVYDKHNKVNGEITADPTTTIGTNLITEMVLSKYGHLRAVKSPLDGNTWFEWLFETDVHTSASHDSVLCIESNLSLAGVGYYVMEFDMATRTDFPGNMQIMAEARAWNSGTEDRGYRYRLALAQYDAAGSKWVAGENTFALAPSEWVHVTVVTKVNPVYTTGENDAQMVNYGTSVSKLYINGEYVNSMNFIPNYALPATADARIYYMGIGYCYGTQHTGTQIDDGIVLDNIVKTVIPASYAADAENDDLAALFAAENAETDVTDISEAIVWNSDYELPETELGVASYIPEEGEEYIAANIEQALQFVKDDENEGATIKLYANRYLPVHIDYPCVIELNGYALQNGYTFSSDLKASQDEGTVTFEYDVENSATIKYYNVDYANIANAKPLKTKYVVVGNAIETSVVLNAVSVTVDGKTGFAPTGEVKVYDEAGNEVALTTIAEENKGKTYVVCPVYKTTTLENDIAFYVEQNGVVTFYDNNDIQAAAVNGEMPANAKVVLVADCVFSSTIYAPANSTLAIDLNGHKLTATTQLFLVGPKSASHTNVDYFFYTSKDGGVIDTRGQTLIQNCGYDKAFCSSYFFGYEDANTKAAGRMTIYFSSKVCYMNKQDLDSIRFYNVELNATGVWALFQAAQARMTYIVELDTCDVFTVGALGSANANATNFNLTIKNSNIYGNGGVMFTDPSGTAAGNREVYLINSKVYNFELGNINNASLSMDQDSMVSFIPTLQNTITGKTATCCIPEVVVIDGVTYVTGYQWLPENTPYATFNYYGVAKDQATADTPIVKTMNIAVGGWWVNTGSANAGIYFDPTVDMNNGYVIATQDVVYDAEGNVVAKTALEEADAGKTYGVYVESVVTDEKVALDLCGYLTLADGTYVPLEGENLSAALKAAFESATIPTGSTLVLLSDLYYTETVYLGGCKIDLNGKTLYVKSKGPSLYAGTKDVDIFIYSSQPGARVFSIPQDNPGQTSYFLEVRSTGIEVFLGYVNKETKSPYNIEAFSGAFIQDQGGSNSTINIANFDIYGLGGDNYGMFNVRGGGTVGVTYNFYNCTIRPDNRNPIFCLREASEGTFNLYDSNIYVTAGAGRQFIGWYGEREAVCAATVTLTNSNLYGLVLFNEAIAGNAVATIYVNEGCTLPFTLDFDYNTAPNFVFPEGYIAIAQAGTITVPTATIPKSGQYGNEDTTYGGQELAYAAVVGVKPAFDATAYKAQAFQNMTLDTNVVGNLYIPVDAAKVLSVTYGGNNIFDETAIEIINGKEYYVITVEVAPKYGNLTATVVVNLEYGNTAEFVFSVANYAKALFALDGTNNAYVADSQKMMKYVLTYIKEVAVAFGGADATTIFAGLDIAVDTNVTVQEAVKDTTAINTYVTHAALDLDAYAGFAFKVANTFVGTVRVEMAGVEAVEVTYDAAGAEADVRVVVLQNVPAHLFRGDVTITVTPAEGEAVTAQFNLATYVNANADAAYAKALYAYTVEAKAYNTKYPTVNTVN